VKIKKKWQKSVKNAPKTLKIAQNPKTWPQTAHEEDFEPISMIIRLIRPNSATRTLATEGTKYTKTLRRTKTTIFCELCAFCG